MKVTRAAAAGLLAGLFIPLGLLRHPVWGQPRPIQETPRYRLGPGDRLGMKVFQVDGFEAVASVLPDGTLNLPRINTVNVWGLTLDEARGLITDAYSKVLRNPLVYLDLVTTRPFRVSVTGAVQRPGIYSMCLSQTNIIASQSSRTSQKVSSQGWPTLVEAIQKAGGLTSNGDLRRVMLTRHDVQSGSPKVITYDFWKALQSGALIQNPLIYDGDSIRILEAEEQEMSELLMIASSSFAPSSIQVTVVGEVNNPGLLELRANSPLSKAILAAGGVNKRGNQNTMQLLRLLPNGSIDKRILAFKPGKDLGDKNNPPLQNGDVILVNRHNFAKFNDGIKATVEPFSPLLNAASIFNILGAPIK